MGEEGEGEGGGGGRKEERGVTWKNADVSGEVFKVR